MQNPFAHGNFRDRSRPFIVVVFLLAGLLVAGGMLARPAWRAFKGKRAIKFVAQARVAMAATNFAVSKANLVAAYEMSPFLPDVIRAAAEHYTLLGRPIGLQLWEQLEGTGEMNTADRIKWSGLALNHRSFQVVKQALAPLAATKSTDPDVLRILSGLYAAGGRFDAARQAARAACLARPDRSDLQLHLAKLEAESGEPSVMQEGVGKLMALLVRPEPVAGLAALILLNPERTNGVNHRLVARLVERIPLSDPVVELVKLVVRCRTLPPETVRPIAAALLKDRDITPNSPQFMTIVLGLVSLREYSLVTQLIPEDLAVGGEDLGSIRLEALFRLNDWAGVESLLNRRAVKVSKPVEATYRAMVAHFQGHTNELGNLWRAAIAASQRSPDLLEIVAERAEYTGAWAEATRAWRDMLPFTDVAPRAAREVLRLSERTNDREAALQAYRRLSQLSPGDPDLRLQVALHQLLVGVDEIAAQKTLAEGESAFTSPELYRVAAALAALRQRQPDSAVQTLEGVSLRTNSPSLWRVIKVGALGAAGLHADARNLAEDLDPGRLSAPELALVKDWLR